MEREVAAVGAALEALEAETVPPASFATLSLPPPPPPPGVALRLAVGRQRLAGLLSKRDEAAKALSAAVKAVAEGEPTRRPAPHAARPAPRPRAQLEEIDVLPARASRATPSAGPSPASAVETERESLIRRGLLTPFASLPGFERAMKDSVAQAAAAARARADARPRTMLVHAAALPRLAPAARPHAARGATAARRAFGDGAGVKERSARRAEHRAKMAAAAEAGEAGEEEGGSGGEEGGDVWRGGRAPKRRRVGRNGGGGDKEWSDHSSDGDDDGDAMEIEAVEDERRARRSAEAAAAAADAEEAEAVEEAEGEEKAAAAAPETDAQLAARLQAAEDAAGAAPRTRRGAQAAAAAGALPSLPPPAAAAAALRAQQQQLRRMRAAPSSNQRQRAPRRAPRKPLDFGMSSDDDGADAAARTANASDDEGAADDAEGEEGEEEEEEAADDVVFDGGLTVPGGMYSRLFDYQKTGLKWLWELHCQRAGGIIGDESACNAAPSAPPDPVPHPASPAVGLGKTVQLAAFLGSLHHSGLYKPSLVVCPATMLRQWQRELTAWYPPFEPVILHESGLSSAASVAGGGSRAARAGLIRSATSNPDGVLLTTYEHLRLFRDQLLVVPWGYVVLDEGHKIRNPDAEVTQIAKQLPTVHRIIMSGAPIQNRLTELWSLFDFVFPGKLGTLPVFAAQFAVPISLGGYTSASPTQVATAFRCAVALRDIIAPFLLRRMKADVALHLPKKTEQVLFCPLTQPQRNAYRAFLASRDCEAILEGRREALAGIDTLRKICNHPDLLERAEQGANPDYGAPERAGKMLVTLRILGLWASQGHRALVFAQTQQMLDILEDGLMRDGHAYRRMDGSTPVGARMRLIDEFNDPASGVFVFLLTTKVGGLGVNLTGADRVLLYDPDWNPATDAQARERAWRVGQTRPVTVYRLICGGTIEEKVYHRQVYKQHMSDRILKDPRQRRVFKQRELAELFTLDEKASGGEGGAGAATSQLFAHVDAEVTAAAAAEAEAEAAEAEEAAADARDVEEEEAEPVPGGAGRSISLLPPPPAVSARGSVGGGGAGASSAPSAATDNARILSSLFASGGGVGGAMDHDVIATPAGGPGGGARSHADRVEGERVARRAAEAVAASSAARGALPVSVPTWTGRRGLAGAPAPRGSGGGGGFGGGMPSSAELVARAAARAAAASAALAASSSAAAATSSAAGAAARLAAAATNGGGGGGASEPSGLLAAVLLRDVVAFLRSRGGRATSEAVLGSPLGARVNAQQAPLFRAALRAAATLEREAQPRRGRGGGGGGDEGAAQWVLRAQYRGAAAAARLDDAARGGATLGAA